MEEMKVEKIIITCASFCGFVDSFFRIESLHNNSNSRLHFDRTTVGNALCVGFLSGSATFVFTGSWRNSCVMALITPPAHAMICYLPEAIANTISLMSVKTVQFSRWLTGRMDCTLPIFLLMYLGPIALLMLKKNATSEK